MDHRVTSGQQTYDLMNASQKLMGNQDRLLVAAAVADAEPGALYAQNLASMIGIADARIGPQLARFEALGLLVRMPRTGGDRRVYYERRNDAFWKAVASLRDALVDG